ncbi:hypothetical protein [Methanococcoides methylutens]|uniref:Uncharacterized protein n=1 Tax=Methanococcoides methylutens MM1 TaxID=1434104 RepID=A0A0E3X1X3_METMT|nr:hypothetical protein [Methanococcoides methylutens]AKB85645.1 hypothetical protein MCMEM_1592 [Methanococcoides methylutens MM1]
MKRGTMKGFAIIAAVLMVVSLLPISALAANGDGFETAPGQMKKNLTDDDFDPAQDRDRLRSNFQDAKNDYNKVTAEFQNVKAQQARGQLTSEEMLDKSKVYLNGTVDYMVERLNYIKDTGGYSEDVNDTITSYTDALNDTKIEIGAAETRKDLSDVLKDIRKLWKDAIKDIRSFNEMKVGEHLDDHIANANRISERLQNEIKEMEENGQNVEDLQDMLKKYNDLIAEAESLQKGGDTKDAIEATREANEVLRELLQEMKQNRKGFVHMEGEGPLNAEGDGTIVLSGQLNVTINATDAMLVIKDLNGDAYINVTGEYDLVNEERAGEGDHALVYHDFTGDAIINGTRLTIMVRGEDMTIFAEGSGSASLSGEGNYRIGEGDEAFGFAGDAAKAEVIDEEDVDDEEETENEIEIEVEFENGQANVIVKINGTIEYEFDFDTNNQEEIKNYIMGNTSLTYEQINDSITFETEED